jgi:hypothetical protein
MDDRTKPIIATLASVVLCGCPGLFLFIFGFFAAAGNMPFKFELNGVSNSDVFPPTIGLVLICLSLILIVIPIVVGFLALRIKPAGPLNNSEPLPPPS